MEEFSAFSAKPRLRLLLDHFSKIKDTRQAWKVAYLGEVYGDPNVHPQPEEYWGHVNPIGTRSCYDEGKRCAETEAAAAISRAAMWT
jgi:hypothetical protein